MVVILPLTGLLFSELSKKNLNMSELTILYIVFIHRCFQFCSLVRTNYKKHNTINEDYGTNSHARPSEDPSTRQPRVGSLSIRRASAYEDERITVWTI